MIVVNVIRSNPGDMVEIVMTDGEAQLLQDGLEHLLKHTTFADPGMILWLFHQKLKEKIP